eukprot:4541166-Pleurochrysis_carterae.AAC.3
MSLLGNKEGPHAKMHMSTEVCPAARQKQRHVKHRFQMERVAGQCVEVALARSPEQDILSLL